MRDNNEFCGACKFYDVEEEFDRVKHGMVKLEFGRCHRHAPTPVTTPGELPSKDDYFTATWVTVHELDWCGEYQKAEGELAE